VGAIIGWRAGGAEATGHARADRQPLLGPGGARHGSLVGRLARARALTRAAADELRVHGIHVALVIVDGPIASPKTARMTAGLAPEQVNDQADIAAAVASLAGQGARGRANELTLSPAGRPPAQWS